MKMNKTIVVCMSIVTDIMFSVIKRSKDTKRLKPNYLSVHTVLSYMMHRGIVTTGIKH